MAGDPHDILRLKRCPECDYDLIGLPHAHNCPECGFTYSEDFFDVSGHPWRHSLSLVRIFLLLGICLIIIFAMGWVGLMSFTDLIPAFVGFAFLGGMAVAARYTGQDVRKIRLIFTENGVLIRVKTDKKMVRPWSAMNSVSVVRLSDNKWLLRIRAPIFSRLILTYGLTAARVNVTLACTDDEAALVRQELQQRLQRAKSSIDTS